VDGTNKSEDHKSQNRQPTDNDSELSHDKQALNTSYTVFDDVDSKNTNLFNTTLMGEEEDPEQAAREEYMRKLMSFRKDELVLADDSDEYDDEDEGTDELKQP